MDHEFWKNEKKFKDRQRQEDALSSNAAKERIRNKAQISVKTCAIGALSDMEEALGYLWKHGEKYENLTPEEKKIRDRWNEIRDSILDRAENSKRLLLREIDRTEFKNYKSDKFTTIIRNKNGDSDGR